MPNYAVIDADNKVVNVIVADNADIAQQITGKLCIEYSDDAPAYNQGSYDPVTGAFSAPAPPE